MSASKKMKPLGGFIDDVAKKARKKAEEMAEKQSMKRKAEAKAEASRKKDKGDEEQKEEEGTDEAAAGKAHGEGEEEEKEEQKEKDDGEGEKNKVKSDGGGASGVVKKTPEGDEYIDVRARSTATAPSPCNNTLPPLFSLLTVRLFGPVCVRVRQLSSKRRVTVRMWHGGLMVDVREMYDKFGEMHPGKKGIALNLPQWRALMDNAQHIEQMIQRAQR